MKKQDDKIRELSTRCFELQNIVQAQAIAIKSFTELLGGMPVDSRRVQTMFDNEVFSQIIRFDGGIILLK